MNQDKTFILTFPITMVFSVIVMGVLWIVFGMYIGLSFLLGSMVSLMAMSSLYKSSMKLLTDPKDVAVKASIRNYIFRYLFYALILVIAGISENLELIAVAAGLFSFRICLTASLYLEKRRGDNDE